MMDLEPFLPIIAGPADAGIGEDGGITFGGFFCLVVEPEHGCDLLNGSHNIGFFGE